MTRLRDFLRSRGSTQNEAAEILGISKTSLSGKAKGHVPFKQGEMKTLAEHYKMTDDELREVFFDGMERH